jgi:aryl-alcohol dehydrogenase-like predicted oxidoreductase
MRRRAWRHGTVSAVGFGCMSFGGFYGPTNEAESMRALDLGVDFWDTANVYGDGLCEQVIGKFLAEDKSRRARVTLATKFAIRRREDGSRFFDNSAVHIREALDASRKRLGVDHIELYYVDQSTNQSRSKTRSENWRASSKRARLAQSAFPRSRLTRSGALMTCIRLPPSSRNIHYGRATPNLASLKLARNWAQFWSPSRRSLAAI